MWDITWDRNTEGGHSTQKPVECMERPLRNHAGDVYDPFVGSGTSIIAAERQNRTCYAMEIDPAYVPRSPDGRPTREARRQRMKNAEMMADNT